jgi:hypothetical protein
VSIYQNPRQGPDAAPRLQVLRLSKEPNGAATEQHVVAAAAGAATEQAAPAAPASEPEVMAHVQRVGDVGGMIGDWIGTKGSKNWVEGFGMAPKAPLKPEDVEYQGVLGRNWLSPWVEGGKYCGSRGMALPLLGIKVRLKGDAANAYECSYSATFIDGSEVGPVRAGETCEAESLAPMESFQVQIHPRAGAASGATQPAKKAAAETKPKASAKPKAAAKPTARR